MGEVIKQLAYKVDNLTNHIRILETQIVQVANSSSSTLGKFLGKSEMNPNEHCNVVTLRSGKVLEEPKESVDEQVEVTYTQPTGGDNEKETEGKGEEPSPITQVRTYRLPIPFPQRLVKAKLNEQFDKFL